MAKYVGYERKNKRKKQIINSFNNNVPCKILLCCSNAWITLHRIKIVSGEKELKSPDADEINQ